MGIPDQVRPAGLRVYVDMVGDLCHAGHVSLLREARQHGDDLAPEAAESVYGPAVSAQRLVQVRRVLDLSTSQIIQRVRDRRD